MDVFIFFMLQLEKENMFRSGEYDLNVTKMNNASKCFGDRCRMDQDLEKLSEIHKISSFY